MGFYEVGWEGWPGYVWAESKEKALESMLDYLRQESGYLDDEIEEAKKEMTVRLVFNANEDRSFVIGPSDVPFTALAKKHGID